jgi:hypothetical protein
VNAAADRDAEARQGRIWRERRVRTFTDHDGAWNLHARGPVEAGATVMAALHPLLDEVFRQAHGDRTPGVPPLATDRTGAPDATAATDTRSARPRNCAAGSSPTGASTWSWPSRACHCLGPAVLQFGG